MLWGFFGGLTDGGKHRAVLGENLVKSLKYPRIWLRFTYQHNNNPKDITIATMKWFTSGVVRELS